MENSFNRKIENNSNPVPEGVNEKYFWDVVKIIAGSKPNEGEFYKSGGSDDLGSFDRERSKSGSYEPFMEGVISKAQEIVLNPESSLSEEKLKDLFDTDFKSKRKALSEAYNRVFDPEQTHAQLGDKNGKTERTRLD